MKIGSNNYIFDYLCQKIKTFISLLKHQEIKSNFSKWGSNQEDKRLVDTLLF